MSIQETIVYIIIAATAIIIIRHAYRKARSKHDGCSCGSCGSCPANDGKCCCSTTRNRINNGAQI